MELLAVVLAQDDGVSDDGLLRLDGAGFDWIPKSTEGHYSCVVLMRDPGQGGVRLGVEVKQASGRTQVVRCRNGAADESERPKRLAVIGFARGRPTSELGIVRVSANYEGIATPAVWTEVEVRG